ncbi:unnamed protein product [Calicophoron daubneyi]|uniref:SCP domain-containing protein n=1 Tax=Calicophoron daubneyi TaxID=300641 RepID=A0AAV2TE67_CALDB
MVDNALNEEAISLHNQYRALHGCPPLTYDSSLARSAQLWAQELAKTQNMRHSAQENYGENLAYMGSTDLAELSGKDATDMWYSQLAVHDFQGGFLYETCYFTQLVWKGSKIVGFGRARTADGHGIYIVAHYAPKGNVRNLFGSNVFPQDITQSHRSQTLPGAVIPGKRNSQQMPTDYGGLDSPSTPKLRANVDGPAVYAPRGSLVANGPHAPNVDLETSRVSGPRYDAPDISTPDVSLPRGKYDAPNVSAPRGSLNTPDVTVPHGKYDAPNISAPRGSLNAPDVSVPRGSFDTPKVSAPRGSLNTPDVTVPRGKYDAPNVSAPRGSLNTPDVTVPHGKYDAPNISAPRGSLNAPDVSVPRGSLNTPGMSTPKANISTPEVSAPRGSLKAAELSTPKASVDAPGIYAPPGSLKAAGLSTPRASYDMPSASAMVATPQSPVLSYNRGRSPSMGSVISLKKHHHGNDYEGSKKHSKSVTALNNPSGSSLFRRDKHSKTSLSGSKDSLKLREKAEKERLKAEKKLAAEKEKAEKKAQKEREKAEKKAQKEREKAAKATKKSGLFR